MGADYPVWTGDQVGDIAGAWPTLEHETLGRGVLQDFVRDKVATPDGGTMIRDYLVHTGAVGVIAMDDAGHLLVVRQYRHPVGATLIEPPAGLLDVSGEDWLAAAQRELAEEVGMQAGDWRVLVDFYTSPGCLGETLRVFLARQLSPAPRPDGFVADAEEADMDVAWIHVDDVVDAIFDGRIGNPTMVAGALALQTALRDGRLGQLRSPDAPWPARAAKLERDAAIAALGDSSA